MKEIKGYEGEYFATKEGQIWSSPKGTSNPRGKFLKTTSNHNGYQVVSLKGKQFRVHRIIAETFIPNLLNEPHVNHKDADKENNNVSNLEWTTPLKNMAHAYQHGLVKTLKGEGCIQSILKENEVNEIRQKASMGIKQIFLAKNYGVSAATICNIVNRKIWKHL